MAGERRAAVAAGSGPFLNEAQSLAVLAAAGVPVVAHRLCRSAKEAGATRWRPRARRRWSRPARATCRTSRSTAWWR